MPLVLTIIYAKLSGTSDNGLTMDKTFIPVHVRLPVNKPIQCTAGSVSMPTETS